MLRMEHMDGPGDEHPNSLCKQTVLPLVQE